MTITLPADVREQAERQAKAAGFASVEEYVAELVREDRGEWKPGDPMPFDREAVGRLLDEASGDETVVADDAFWAEEHRKLMEYVAERGQTP